MGVPATVKGKEVDIYLQILGKRLYSTVFWCPDPIQAPKSVFLRP